MSLHDEQLGRLTRLFVIYHRLEMCGHTETVRRRDLELACNCTAKTIQRDLRFLQDAGASVTYDYRRRSYVLEKPLPMLHIELQISDLMALVLMQGAAQQSGVPLPIQSRALNKLMSRLSLKLRDEMATAREAVDFGEAARRDYSQAPLHELVTATRDRRTIRMTYYSIGRDVVETRLADPYSLTLRNGYLSLVAFCHQNKAVRLFALDNIRGLQSTKDSFQMAPNFSLSTYLEGMVGGMRGTPTNIEIRFKPEASRWARKIRWEFPYRQEETSQGLVVRGQVSGLKAIQAELLRWGAGVEVLSPRELRETMRAEAQAIVQIYAKK